MYTLVPYCDTPAFHHLFIAHPRCTQATLLTHSPSIYDLASCIWKYQSHLSSCSHSVLPSSSLSPASLHAHMHVPLYQVVLAQSLALQRKSSSYANVLCECRPGGLALRALLPVSRSSLPAPESILRLTTMHQLAASGWNQRVMLVILM